ncbi:MAG: hypothetical protein IKN49_04505 [Elusimicrobiaceae bacterium]|nr:hypothetical protein [Elusimicrobiaceae bacterium]
MLRAVLLYSFTGFIILSLPFMQSKPISLIDNLFTAASAVSTTGLTSVNFAESYNFLGKLIVLLFIQFAGIGYMTMSSFIYLSFSHRLRHRHMELLNTEFALPRTVRLNDFLHAVIIFTFVAELIGTAFLYNYFYRHGYGVFNAIWYAVFHSVSAFCTAGFSLFPDSFLSFEGSKTINLVISLLSLAGAMGFIVVTDLFNRLFRRTAEISYTTKIIVLSTLAALLASTFVIIVTNPGLDASAALFQAIAAMTTAGFSTVSIQSWAPCSLLIIMALMTIGGSPSGTGGGLKTTTFTCLIATVSSHLLGRKHITFLGKQIPVHRLYIANSTFIFYSILLFWTLFLLVWTENLPFLDLFFEAVAALGTGGMSIGATEKLSVLGKLIIIMAMLVGRVGVLTFGMALLKRDEDELLKEEEKTQRADLAV